MEQMIVFDLDGTLALDEHRVHHLRGEKKDWDSYFGACKGDSVCEPIRSILKAFHWGGHHTLGLWTGRSASVRELTMEWLHEQKLHDYFDQFRMRDADDRTDDMQLKRQWLHEQNLTDPVTLVFEDRQRVVDMWRSEGIVCCQVAPGAF
jgi:FMN phosphatase YigB (HAD superfamily)